MALAIGDLLRLSFRYTYLGQSCQNVQFYQIVDEEAADSTVLELVTGIWNSLKTEFRAVASTSTNVNAFNSVLGQEIGGTEEFGEYTIPTGERAGTRVAGDDGEWVAGIMAIGGKQTVATRQTRPGQKRFPFIREGDISGNSFGSGILALYEPLFSEFSTQRTFTVTAGVANLNPVVVHFPSELDPEQREQVITGYQLNPLITSQVSRKARLS